MVPVYLASFIASVVLSFIVTRYVRNKAVSRGWLMGAASVHHIHKSPVPRLGGIAIYFSVIAVILALVAASSWFGVDLGLDHRTLFYILLSGTLVFLVGLYDDVYSASPYFKLAAEGLAAVLLFYSGLRVFQVPLLFGGIHFGWFALPLTIIWVLWITNAFNLIDGLDGLAAGSALFSTLTVFAISLTSYNGLVSLLTIALAGAILGFLRFNFSPATIFLGDSGSLFIGFMLSALALAGAQKTPTLVAVAIPVVSFGLPVLETVLSVIRRFLSGQPLFGADREHIHHKLLERGWTQKQAVIVLYGVSAAFGMLSLFLLYPGGKGGGGQVGIVLFVIGLGIWLGVQRLGYYEFFELGRVFNRTIGQKRVIEHDLSIRRMIKALRKAESVQQLEHILESGFEGGDFDGFHLCFKPSFGGQGIDLKVDLSSQSSNGHARKGRENGRANKRDAAVMSEWTFTLELITSNGQKCGQFFLSRRDNDRPLLIDINLLISELPTALADAAYGVANSIVENREELKEPTRFVATPGASC